MSAEATASQTTPNVKTRSRWWVYGQRVLICMGGIYGGLLVLLLLLESTLVYPAPQRTDAERQILKNEWPDECEEVFFNSSDGTRLRGVLARHTDETRLMLLCTGNGEDCDTATWTAATLRDRCRANVFVFDYRGYGKSEGKPIEDGIISDGVAAMEWLCDQFASSPDQVVVYGRSIGGGVGVGVAEKTGARGLVLDRTFESLVGVAAGQYPIFPIRLLMRNRYCSAQRMGELDIPVLQLHGTTDEVVPFASGQALFAACKARDKTFITLPNVRHNDPQPDEAWLAIVRFVDRMLASDKDTDGFPDATNEGS